MEVHPTGSGDPPSFRSRMLAVPGHSGRLQLTTRMRLLIVAQLVIFMASLEDEEIVASIVDGLGLSAGRAVLVELVLALALLSLWGLCMIAWLRLAERRRKEREATTTERNA